MIFDHRTYTCRPGAVRRQLALYDTYGREAQIEHLGGEPLYYAETSDTGMLNTYIHIWAYDTIGEREERRASLIADQRWVEFRKQMFEHAYLISQETRILWPAPFFKYTRRPAGAGAPRKALFDHRTYTCHPGKVANELKIYGETGYEPQINHLGEPLLYGYSESGKLNSYTHIWVYENAEDRATKRAAMVADEGWKEFRRRSQDARNRMMQETRIMTPAPFFRM